MRRLRRSLLLVALATSALLVPALPAAAAPGYAAARFVGSGTIAPGISPGVMTTQSISLTGTMSGVFQGGLLPEAATLSCNFGGLLFPGAPGTGVLHLFGSCTGSGLFGPVNLSCSLSTVVTYPPTCAPLTGFCTVSTSGGSSTFTAVFHLCFAYAPSTFTSSVTATGDLAGATPI